MYLGGRQAFTAYLIKLIESYFMNFATDLGALMPAVCASDFEVFVELFALCEAYQPQAFQ